MTTETYTVDAGPVLGFVTYTFTEDENGEVVAINSDNPVFVILFGYMGITFSTPISIAAAKALADGISTQLSG